MPVARPVMPTDVMGTRAESCSAARALCSSIATRRDQTQLYTISLCHVTLEGKRIVGHRAIYRQLNVLGWQGVPVRGIRVHVPGGAKPRQRWYRTVCAVRVRASGSSSGVRTSERIWSNL